MMFFLIICTVVNIIFVWLYCLFLWNGYYFYVITIEIHANI
jgi:hypothetical protein